MITHEKSGGRTIHLFIPFEYNKQKIESITIAPLRFGHVLRWGKGEYKTMLDLLVDMAGIDEAVINNVRYPDADRVIESFMGMLTPEMRRDIAEGVIPLPPPVEGEAQPKEERQERFELEPATNGRMIGPGQPLPPEMQAGFDLSEEP